MSVKPPCTRDHAALKADPAAWAALALVGIQPGGEPLPGETDQPPDLELRDCPCGSTLARPKPRGAG